jgi:hypothetical protein
MEPLELVRRDAAGRRYYESVGGRVYVADEHELRRAFRAPPGVARKARLAILLGAVESCVHRARADAEALVSEVGAEELRRAVALLEEALASVERVRLPELLCEECGRARIAFASEREGGWRLLCPACAAKARERGATLVLLTDR